MEEINPWLDPDSGKHKNKKSVKPAIPASPQSQSTEQDEKFRDFLKILVEDSLQETFSKDIEEWISENMDKEYLTEIIEDTVLCKKKILSSKSVSSETLFLLKYIFLLQQRNN